MQILNHYTYKVTLPETGEYYIGVRSCKCLPEEDTYKGSMCSWKVDKSKLVKEIYTTFKSRELANEWERLAIETCIDEPLNRNYHIPSVGYHVFGLKGKKPGKPSWNKGISHSEEHKRKLSIARQKRIIPPFTEEHKRKISESNKGKKASEKTRKLLSESHKGIKQSEESKKMKSDAMKNKKWFNNGIKNIRIEPGKEPKGFCLGKLKK